MRNELALASPFSQSTLNPSPTHTHFIISIRNRFVDNAFLIARHSHSFAGSNVFTHVFLLCCFVLIKWIRSGRPVVPSEYNKFPPLTRRKLIKWLISIKLYVHYDGPLFCYVLYSCGFFCFPSFSGETRISGWHAICLCLGKFSSFLFTSQTRKTAQRKGMKNEEGNFSFAFPLRPLFMIYRIIVSIQIEKSAEMETRKKKN